MIFLGTRAFFDPGKFEEISLQYQNLTKKIMWAKNLKRVEWVSMILTYQQTGRVVRDNILYSNQ